LTKKSTNIIPAVKVINVHINNVCTLSAGLCGTTTCSQVFAVTHQ